MKRLLLSLLFLPLVLAVYSACTQTNGSTAEAGPDPEWREYWYAGKAEISSYDLDQGRYGEQHAGDAVLIFVAEDFDPKTLTKAGEGSSKKVPVLKMNAEKHFMTGIYPYHMFLMAASPVNDAGHALRATATVTEWCGTAWSDLSLSGGSYKNEVHSYFPGEGDSKQNIDAVFTEDEIWTTIRIDPNRLPQGDIRIIQGLWQARLRHKPLQVVKATATLTKATEDMRSYLLDYGDRTLEINFRSGFPYRIESWEETYTNFGKSMTTRGTRKKTLMLDYWNLHDNEHLSWRDSLGLSGN